MRIKRHEDLIVWQKAIDLAIEVYRVSDMIPREEMHALSDQMRKTAVSIPSKIAQGQDSNLAEEYIRCLNYAKGFKGKLETQLLICLRLRYLTVTDIVGAQTQLCEVGELLNSISLELAAAR